MRLRRSDLVGYVADVAPRLLGARIVSTVAGERVVVRVTEVEGYSGTGEDPASHAHRGRTARNAVMFGPPAHLYVYFTYGMHWCANVVCGPDGTGAGALLRAGEVVEGEAVAFARRPAARSAVELARGPARLASCLGITGELGGVDLLSPASPVRLLGGDPVPEQRLRSGPRVGVRHGADTPWRFWIDGDPTVSQYRPAAPRPPR